ncbi:hypothetical protein INR49_022192, partial [Caranx melampygus]
MVCMGRWCSPVSLDPDTSPHMFEISGPMVDSKVFVCASAAELQKWMQQIEDRRYKSTAQPMSPSHCALSYLGLQERLMVLFPQDVLLLSVDNKRLNIRYEGRLPRHSIRAVERSVLSGRLEFELTARQKRPLGYESAASHCAEAAQEQEGVAGADDTDRPVSGQRTELTQHSVLGNQPRSPSDSLMPSTQPGGPNTALCLIICSLVSK